MNLFRAKANESNRTDGVPEGTFRCDVCRFVQPKVCLGGRVTDSSDNPPTTYTLCGTCALWLGLGTTHLPDGKMLNFSDKQHEKIDGLRQETEAAGGINKLVEQSESTPEEPASRDIIKNSENVTMFKRLNKFRYSTLPAYYLELSSRLTRGEPVKDSEIKKANR